MHPGGRPITPIKQRCRHFNSQSPKLQDRLGYGNLMKRVEDSCKEKARLRRMEQCSLKRNSIGSPDRTHHEIAQEIFNSLVQDHSFISDSDFTQDEYNEMISFIEEEYDYQYSMIVNDYENAIEEAMNYYSELDDESNGIPCPHCCSGILQEVGSQNTSCSKCGIKIPYSLNYIQNQLASIYQTHSCGKALSCNYNSNGSLFFFCNHCGFSTFFVYCCL